MDPLLSPASLARQIEALADGRFLCDPAGLLRDGPGLLRPPQRISTVECAERHRRLPASEAGAVVRYDRWRTPYNVGPMDSLDDPGCNLVVMVKPSRSGGTTVAENYLFKLATFGPMGHVAWVLNTDEAVTDYCRNVVSAMFDPDLNPLLAERVGKARGENLDSFKRVSGYPVEWLAAKDGTFRNREPVFMVSDETDAWTPKYAATPKVQIEGRQKQLGNRRKAAILSHPDRGWGSGVAACYEDSSRGIYVMRCAECRHFAAAHATKFWPGVAAFRLDWTRSDSATNDARLDLAEDTAAMVCPHCGAALNDEQRLAMVDEALREDWGRAGWMHRGQTLDAVEGILGEMDPHPTHGFWVHGLMLKTVTLAKLAREWEAALIAFERTRDASQLREFMSKQMGEIFEGAATLGGVSAATIKARVAEAGYERGTAPPGVRFITASVDVGGRAFDVLFDGWDTEGRCWLLDRLTIRQREHGDGIRRDIAPAGEIDDWMLLLPQVVDRLFPIAGRPGWALPVAAVCIDSGDGNVTAKAREFLRRSLRAGAHWNGWSKVKLIKGVAGKRPAVPDAPRKVEKDEYGRMIEPVFEYALGVDRLKEMVFEMLAAGEGEPGFCRFPAGLEHRYVDQFFGEALVDRKWVRSGPNETLDLRVYSIAARLILRPDRDGIRWDQSCIPAGQTWTEALLPVWARPVAQADAGSEGEAPVEAAAQARPLSIYERFDRLND